MGTQVQIFGHVYHLRGGEDPVHSRQVAQLVDDRMNAIADQINTSDSFRIAVLAALHIADEYLQLQREHERFTAEVAAKSDRMVAMLDKVGEPPALSKPLF
jgi:cell division protein ZapA